MSIPRRGVVLGVLAAAAILGGCGSSTTTTATVRNASQGQGPGNLQTSPAMEKLLERIYASATHG